MSSEILGLGFAAYSWSPRQPHACVPACMLLLQLTFFPASFCMGLTCCCVSEALGAVQLGTPCCKEESRSMSACPLLVFKAHKPDIPRACKGEHD